MISVSPFLFQRGMLVHFCRSKPKWLYGWTHEHRLRNCIQWWPVVWSKHKPRPLRNITWNNLFLAVALSFSLNPTKASKGRGTENFIIARVLHSVVAYQVLGIICSHFLCEHSWQVSFSRAGKNAIPQEGNKEKRCWQSWRGNPELFWRQRWEGIYRLCRPSLLDSSVPWLRCAPLDFVPAPTWWTRVIRADGILLLL